MRRSLALLLAVSGVIPLATTYATPETVMAGSTTSVTTGSAIESRPSTSTESSLTSTIRAFDHIYVIVMENKEYGSIVGNSAAPYINRLIARYGLATNYDAIAHPSEPNYLALFSGSTQGVTDDGTHNLSGKNLVDQLEAHGKSWRVFAQNVPLGCYTGSYASGGEDGSGTYARKHEPAISFTDIGGNSTRCSHITDFMHFNPLAASFELIVPNLCNDMHDCSISAGDWWLSTWVPKITGSSDFANSALLITWDEGSTSIGGGGHVATIVVSPNTAAGLKSSTWHNHYSLLRTIEDSWGLGCLNNSCAVSDMRELLGG